MYQIPPWALKVVGLVAVGMAFLPLRNGLPENEMAKAFVIGFATLGLTIGAAGEWLQRRQDRENKVRRTQTSAGVILGTLVVVAGVAVTAVAFGADTTVPTEIGSVHNVGLMHERQVKIVVGIGLCVFGLVVAVASRAMSSRKGGDSGRRRGSVADEIGKLKDLLDDGAITRAEYERKKRQLLDS